MYGICEVYGICGLINIDMSVEVSLSDLYTCIDLRGGAAVPCGVCPL